MRLAALIPETAGPALATGSPAGDALYRFPRLRALSAPALARVLGLPLDEAREGLARVTFDATGAMDRSDRSLDERFAKWGRSAPPVSWADASGPPPRNVNDDAGAILNDRYLKAPLPLGFVYDLGQLQQFPPDPQNTNEPDPRILDKLALFAWSTPAYGTTGYGTDVPWSGLSASQQTNLRQLWREQLRGKFLPTDSEADNPARRWPDSGDTMERQIYFWDIEGSQDEIVAGKGRVLQRMQLQKWSNKDAAWKVYNQWGQDLLFTRQGDADKWIAGWDLGTWFRQNEAAFAQMLIRAFQAVALGVATVFSAGAAVPAVAAGIAAWEATVRGLTALANGDINGAITNLTAAAQGFGNLLGKTAEGKQWGEALDKWIKANAPVVQNLASDAKSVFNVFVKSLDKIKGQLNALNLPLLRQAAAAVGVTLPKIDPIADVKKALDEAGSVRSFLERGYKEIAAGHIPDDVPWYARAAYVQGQTYRAAVDAQRLGAGSFIGGTILRPTMQRFDPAVLQQAQQLNATADEYCRSADVMRKANRPKEAAILQAQCDAARVKATAMTSTSASTSSSGGAVVAAAGAVALLWWALKR